MHSCHIIENLKPVLEGIHSPNGFIGGRTRGEAASRGVREIPITAVKAEPIVNHHGPVSSRGSVVHEDDLTAIHVTRPLIKHEHPCEVRNICDLSRWELGQKTTD